MYLGKKQRRKKKKETQITTHLKYWNWYRTDSIDSEFTFLMNATENVSHDTIPWSISSTNAVSVKDNISPKLQETGVMTHLPVMQQGNDQGNKAAGSFQKGRKMKPIKD